MGYPQGVREWWTIDRQQENADIFSVLQAF